MNFKLTSFGKPNEKSRFYTLEVKSCVSYTTASSEYIVFKGASIHQTDLYISTLENNINNNNSDKLLIKLLFHHLEHLDSLGERHANRLNSWVGWSFVSLMSHGERTVRWCRLLEHSLKQNFLKEELLE